MWTDKEGLNIWKAIAPKIEELIKKHTAECVRQRPAIVVEANNEAKTAVVRFPLSPNRDDQNMTLNNCTGSNLKSGDSVWVEFAYGLTNAYIAIKNDGRPWGW